jgi:hypothetical protein
MSLPFSITPGAVAGSVGVPYAYQYVYEEGDYLPVTFSIISGSLPDGITLDASSAALSGTPTVAGTFDYTIQMADSNDRTVSTPDSIVITGAPTPTNYNCECSGDDFPTKTLKKLRVMLMTRLGFAAMMVPPPGMIPLLDSFLIEAQELLFRRYKVFRGERWFTWSMTEGTRFYDFAENDDALNGQIDSPVMGAASTADSGGTLAAGTYGYLVTALNANGETLASSEALITTTGATSSNTINWAAVTGATGHKVYGRTPNWETYVVALGEVTTWTDTGAIAPSTNQPPSQNTTGLCSKTLDPRMVTWVGISQDDNNWRPLQFGINPVRYSSIINAIPDSYEIRQCIEVWPGPPDNTWSLRIKGYFGLQQFENDNDATTVDYRAVFLLALANAKTHYGQPDANNYASQLTTFMGDLVAGSHMTRRYIPGEKDRYPATPPRMV